MKQVERTMGEFLRDLSSRAATPGGGSASALVGAVAAALCAMVGRLNDAKDGTPGPLHDTIDQADALQVQMQALIDEDIAAFNALSASWKLSEADPSCQTHKDAAVLRATKSPLAIMEQAVAVMRVAIRGLETSKKNCLSDAGVAGICAHAALESARLNVMINLPGIRDESRRRELSEQASALQRDASILRQQIDALIQANYESGE